MGPELRHGEVPTPFGRAQGAPRGPKGGPRRAQRPKRRPDGARNFVTTKFRPLLGSPGDSKGGPGTSSPRSSNPFWVRPVARREARWGPELRHHEDPIPFGLARRPQRRPDGPQNFVTKKFRPVLASPGGPKGRPMRICQAYMPGAHSRHICLAYVPGIRARHICQAYVLGKQSIYT